MLAKQQNTWNKSVIDSLGIDFDEQLHAELIGTVITKESFEQIVGNKITDDEFNEFINYISPSEIAKSLEQAKYIPLKNYESSYEIWNYYPFTIRNKLTKRELKINYSNSYPRVKLNGKYKLLHRLIAEQFIYNPNPETNTVVDHLSRDRTDYHLSNLRWCSVSENNKNKSGNYGIQYEYVNELPDDAIVITNYGDHQLEFYYYCNDVFYNLVGKQYRILPILTDSKGYQFVHVRTNKTPKTKLMINKFKRDYDLI